MTSYTEHLTIPSSLDEISQVDSFLEHAFSRLSVSEDKQNDILLATTEGVTNAIVHGNKEDENTSVKLTAEGNSDQFSVTIEDEGPGFNPESVPDPTTNSNLLKTGGRGVFLIKEYADKVTYNSHGNRVTITFNLHD